MQTVPTPAPKRRKRATAEDLPAIEQRVQVTFEYRVLFTEDVFFDRKWAYWLRDTIPGTRRVVEVPGGHLFFPEEEPELVARELRAHWAESDTLEAGTIAAG